MKIRFYIPTPLFFTPLILIIIKYFYYYEINIKRALVNVYLFDEYIIFISCEM